MNAPDPQPPGARPSKVTLAATLGGASCLVLIFSLFDTMSRLRGVDMREQVTETLAEPPFDTLAVSTAEVLGAMRVMAFVAGGLAAAGLVLAVYVARRHKGARIGFTVVAALLVLTTPVSGMLTFLVGIAALMLWSEPARAWFGGREPKPAAPRRQEIVMSGDRSSGGSSGSSWPYGPQGGEESSGAHPAPQPPHPQGSQPPPYSGSYGDAGEPESGSGSGQEPRPEHPEQPSWQQPGSGQPVQGEQPPWSGQPQSGQQPPYGQGHDPQSQPYGSPYGSSPSYGASGSGQYGQQYGYPPYGQHGQGQGGSGKRPGTVTTAAVLTMIGALGGLLMGVILMAGLAVDSSAISDQLRDDPSFDQIGWDVDQVLSAIWVVAVILTLWSLIAMVLAVFVLRRQQWARWLLVASATVSALLSLLAILSLISIVPLILSVATVVLLFTGGANAWFSGRERHDQPPSGPQWSSSPGPW